MTLPRRMLVLGLGNRLLGDDAVGPMVLDRLKAAVGTDVGLRFVDGGTVGLALLPLIEDAAALIAVDAARMGATPGAVQVYEGAAMDALLQGRKNNAHEVALADLMGAAALRDALPARRALVAVQADQVHMALGLSAAVQAALPALCDAVLAQARRWQEEVRPILEETHHV
ncbi:hydrogenase maturation protease [Burkholderiales bacterium JOSHI_001]|nr:hydrogenase maturation protease [Burkholderiales bacterium JOSHI_001]